MNATAADLVVRTLDNRHRISTEDQLRELLGEPSQLVMDKALPELDTHMTSFVRRSPFYLLATASAAGTCDVSPRGDPSASVMVPDAGTLVLPDRPGNRRADSLRNIIANSQVGLLFMIPGVEETVRVNGRAHLTTEPGLLAELAVEGKTPKLAIVIAVAEAFMHCGKALRRSSLWQPDTWPDRAETPTLGRIIKDQLKMPDPVEQLDAGMRESYEKRLY